MKKTTAYEPNLNLVETITEAKAPTLEMVVEELKKPRTRLIPEGTLFRYYKRDEGVGYDFAPLSVRSNQKRQVDDPSDPEGYLKVSGCLRIGLLVDPAKSLYKMLFDGFYINSEWSMDALIDSIGANISDILAAHGVSRVTAPVVNEIKEEIKEENKMKNTKVNGLEELKKNLTGGNLSGLNIGSVNTIGDSPLIISTNSYSGKLPLTTEQKQALVERGILSDHMDAAEGPMTRWYLKRGTKVLVPSGAYSKDKTDAPVIREYADLSHVLDYTKGDRYYGNNEYLGFMPYAILDPRTGVRVKGQDGGDKVLNASGSEILVHRDPKWYNGEINIRSFTDIPLFCSKNNTDVYLYVYGVGDHGGGPTRRDIETMIDNAAFPLYPTIEFGTYGKYFAELERFRDILPVVKQELNFVFTGCYTSQSRVKMSNRLSEDRLYESEMLSAAANKLTGATDKTDLYADAWENVLFNHFHDILPGSGVIETREYALGLFQETLAVANTNANTAMRNIADSIDTSAIAFDESKNTNSEGGGVGYGVSNESGHTFPQAERGRGSVRVIHLFNSTMYDRSEAVEVTLWDYNYDLGRVMLTDADGREIPFQFTVSGAGYWGHNYTKLLLWCDIPAFGYNTYIVKLRAYDAFCAFVSPSDPRQDYISDDPLILENEFIKATFDPLTMALTRLDDKTTRKSPVTPECPSAIFRLIKENPRFGMTSWRVGPYMHVADLNSTDFDIRVQDYRHEPLRSFLRYEIAFASSKLNVLAMLKKGAKVIEFDVTVDWHEIGRPGNFIPQLNFYMPVGYTAVGYKYDIPFGTIDRGDIAHDVPGNSFIQIMSGEEKSVFIVTDSKYGFRGTGNAGAVTLIRGSYDPDPYPEYGKHHFRLGVGVCCDGCLMKYTGEFCHPIAFNAGTKQSGVLPMSDRLLTLEGNVRTSAVKNAEDGGLVIRLSEYNGKAEKVTLKLAFTPQSATLVDITERHTVGECDTDGSEVSFTVPADSIVTVLIK